MSVINLDVFPEIIVAFSLCPIGFALTFILHYSPLGVTIISGFHDLLWGPYVVIIACAIISCIVMHTVKLVHHKYRFEHMYLILVGLIFTLISALSMIFYKEHAESRLLMFSIAPGIGFVYVPALAYLLARTKDYRHIKISLCHIFCFIGFILGTVILTNYNRNDRIKMLQVYGYVLTAISVVAILLIIVNEVLQFRYKTYFNYKQSSDYNMDYENKFETIFLKPFFKIVSQNVDINLNNYKLNILKMTGYVIYLIVVKLIGLVYFYYPMVYINITLSTTDLFYCYLVSIIGLVASTILLQFIKIKTNFIVSLILKIISFLVLILFLNIYEITDDALMIFYWIHTIFLLYGNNVNDILVLELAKLKYTELVLTIGLILEILVNGTLHYFVITSPEDIFNLQETMARALLEHIIPIVIVLLLVLFITILVLPDTHNCSLLEIQNIMFFKTYDKKSTGSGTSIQQKEQPVEYGIRAPPNEFVKNPNMVDDDDQFDLSTQFRPKHIQTVSMSSSTATSEFNYRYAPKPPGLPVTARPPSPPKESTYDYDQIKPKPLFPRPRPTSALFDPFKRT